MRHQGRKNRHGHPINEALTYVCAELAEGLKAWERDEAHAVLQGVLGGKASDRYLDHLRRHVWLASSQAQAKAALDILLRVTDPTTGDPRVLRVWIETPHPSSQDAHESACCTDHGIVYPNPGGRCRLCVQGEAPKAPVPAAAFPAVTSGPWTPPADVPLVGVKPEPPPLPAPPAVPTFDPVAAAAADALLTDEQIDAKNAAAIAAAEGHPGAELHDNAPPFTSLGGTPSEAIPVFPSEPSKG
jgi:hypothetical protein